MIPARDLPYFLLIYSFNRLLYSLGIEEWIDEFYVQSYFALLTHSVTWYVRYCIGFLLLININKIMVNIAAVLIPCDIRYNNSNTNTNLSLGTCFDPYLTQPTAHPPAE